MTSISPRVGAGAPTGDIDLGPNASVQLMFAKLQMEQSNLCRTKSEEQMKTIRAIQDGQKKTAAMIRDARAALEEAKRTGQPVKMSPEMKQFFEDNKLPYGGGKFSEGGFTKDQWEVNVKSLSDLQETIGTQTQTLMVYLQDYIGQYNSFLQGANSAIATANQVMTSIARGQ